MWGDTPTSFQYTGQRKDAIIGLYFYNARYYPAASRGTSSAALGQFVQADTIVPNPADPQDLNRYSYVRNNPLRFSDPTGHWYYDPGLDALVQTDADYNEWLGNFNVNSPLYALQQLRRADNPACPYCSTAMLDYGPWYEAHPSYDPQFDSFLNTLQAGGEAAGIGASDVTDATRHYSLWRTAQQLAAGEGWKDLALGALLENGPPLLGAVGAAHGKLGSEAQQAMGMTSFTKIEYTSKVLGQMQMDDLHGFPSVVDNYVDSSYAQRYTAEGGDGVVRTVVDIPGGYKGKTGVFRYIFEPDGLTVNHRMFHPTE